MKITNTLIYGLSLAILLFLLKYLHVKFVVFNHSLELYAGGIAVIFKGLGAWVAMRVRKTKTKVVVVERQVLLDDYVFNEAEAERLGLSKRELEVLELMGEGLSNQEIGDKLFVSLNTVKTHSRRIFEKLEVVRRSQAVDKGRRLGVIP